MESVYVLIRNLGDPGFQAVQGARALATFSQKYGLPNNIIMLSIPNVPEVYDNGEVNPNGNTRLYIFDLENSFKQNDLKYVRTGCFFKNHANIVSGTALAVEGKAKELIKDLENFDLFLKEYRTQYL